jgi:hypothetical protein
MPGVPHVRGKVTKLMLGRMGDDEGTKVGRPMKALSDRVTWVLSLDQLGV